MLDIVTRLFDTSGFPARWQCGSGWTDNPSLGWLHILSDLAVWAAYFAIPGILVFFIVRKRDLPFRMVFLLFGAFILFCGTTHLMEAIIFWWPAYRLAGIIKLLTALVSWATIFALIQVAPMALAMRSPEALEREIKARQLAEDALRQANAELEQRVADRTAELTRVNLVVQNEREWFRTTLASVGDAVIATDTTGHVRFLNLAAESLTGWKPHEAEGKSLAEVLRIVNEDTGQVVENPALRALRDGTAIELSDNTLLIAKDGTQRPIDDSAAPIRDSSGMVSGAVLVFRDVTERRQQDQSLRENEARLNFALMAAELGQWDLNIEDHRVFRSARHDEIFGYDSLLPEWTYEMSLEHVVPEDRAVVAERVQQSISTGVALDVECRIQRKDGAIRWIWGKARVLRNSAGRVERMLGTIADITDRKNVEESLRRSETRLRLALEAGHMGVFDRNLRTSEVQWTDNLEAILGLAPNTFAGTFEAFRQLVHPDDRQVVAETVQRAIDERSKYEIEFRCIWPDGGIHWYVSKAMIFADSQGEPSRVVGVCLDVTERRRAEETSRFLSDASALLSATVEYESTFRQVAELSVPFFADWCIVDIVGKDGALERVAIVHQDPVKLQAALGIKHRFALRADAPYSAPNASRTGESYLVSEITDEMLAAFTQNAEHFQLMRKLHLKSYIAVPVVARGKSLGVISFLTADSQRRYGPADLALAEDLAHRTGIALDNAHLYQELREADRLKDEFLAMLAHELRNPLAPIRNALFIMRSPGADPQMTQQVLAIAERQVQHMARLLDDLLDVSRISRGRIELRKETVDVARVVQLAIEAVQPLVNEAHHELTVTLPSRPAELVADPTRLEQILTNLLNNACKYTEPGGHIWLSAELQGADVVIRVKDTGIGISEEMLPRIFDLFVQADRQLDRSRGGVGIGLTLVRRLVEMHGGTIEATSPGLGQGSEFVVRLPATATDSQDPTPLIPTIAEDQADLPTPHRILVVDDNPDAANSLAILLRMSGYEVVAAFDGPSAIALAKEFLPELIFLDIGMPGMDGCEVARLVRLDATLQDVRLVAVTGWGQPEDRERTAAAGIDQHLVKPIEPSALQKLLGL
ncbi:MAG: domain S-box protein [Planctomycetaceae bacterium]|nr:domain S-box protein [Planctomycetaceae bacterium]